LSWHVVHGVFETERPLTLFFSFIFNRTGGLAACDELRTLGWPDLDLEEELTGDDCWHVAAHRLRIALNEASIIRLRSQMEDIAERHGGTSTAGTSLAAVAYVGASRASCPRSTRTVLTKRQVSRGGDGAHARPSKRRGGDESPHFPPRSLPTPRRDSLDCGAAWVGIQMRSMGTVDSSAGFHNPAQRAKRAGGVAL
jgi:hypothetical protein